MNALAQNYFCDPWYQNEGPTVEEMKKEIKEKLTDTGEHSTMWKKEIPYLYLKAVNDTIEKNKNWPVVSWRGWYTFKQDNELSILKKSKKKYNQYMKIRAMKKLSKLLIPIVKHRLYRFPDGLRIKEVRKSFYQGINK